ncbi:MAG: hypothetical protein R6U27_17240 [Desulfobacterales bacterium]
MRKMSIVRISLMVLASMALLWGCSGMQTKPAESQFKKPVVKLSHAEVVNYWGWWYFAKSVEPTAGDAGDYGAPLNLAFIFDIENPNPYPVRLDSLKFTVAFEEFDLNTVQSMDVQWIPSGKTNQLRVHAMFDGRQSLLSLLVTGGFKLQEKGMGTGAGAALKQLGEWWTKIPEFDFDIFLKEGSAVFAADGQIKVVPFEAKYPPN